MSSHNSNLKSQYLATLDQVDEFLNENIVFNFKYFIYGNDVGESFEEWEGEGILADLNNKLKNFSGKTKAELLRDGTLEIYGAYPKDSKFIKPKTLVFAGIQWARFRITGRRRLIGFFLEDKVLKSTSSENFRNVFFIVFLDKDHMFAPSGSN